MDIKDSYLHGTVGVVKSISVSADKLTYKLADINNTAKTITLPLATQSANGLLSKEDKTKLDQSTGMTQAIPYIVGSTSDTAGVWTGVYSGITEYTDGLTIIYVPKVSGKSSGTTLNINNLGAKNCHYTNASNLTTHFGTGVPIILTYIGGYWKRADYDSWTPYVAAYCSTAAATAAKTASCSSYVLTSKTYIHMLITIANTAKSALTMNINSKGAKPIYINGTASSSSNYTLPAGTYIVYYDGTNFYFRTDGVLPGTIEKATNATSAGKVTNNLILKIKSGSTEDTNLYTYNGSEAKTLDIKQGTGITLTAAANALTITNAGVRSIATGTTNGTISVNTNGTSANVAVKGLGSAAYTNLSSYVQLGYIDAITDVADLYSKLKPYFGNHHVSIIKLKDERGVWGHLLSKFQNPDLGLYGVDGCGLFLREDSVERWSIRGKNTTDDPLVYYKYKVYDEGNLGVVSSSTNGLAPKVISTNTATVGSAYYVLASTNGSATPSWYKLPATAFANDNTKVTLTNTTTDDSYRVLLSGNANDTTETTTARKSTNLQFNPSTKTLTSGVFKGSFITTKSPNIENAWKPQTVMAWFPHISKNSNNYAGDDTGFPVSSNANGILWLGLHDASSNPSTSLGHGYLLGFSSNGNIYSRYFYASVPTTTNGGSWKQIAYTTSNITGNAATATKLKTKRKLWGLDFDGTADVSGSLSEVTKITSDNTSLTIATTGTSGYIYLRYLDDNSKSIVLADTYFGPTEGSNNKLDLGKSSGKWKNVYATSFIGNLDGTYVNKLTGYSKATSAADLAATDTLNVALGKLEYKADTVYDWYKSVTGTDNDDIINKWEEIVDFIDSVKEGTDITDEFVTRKTALTIIGQKNFNTNTNTKPLLISRQGSYASEVLAIGVDDMQASFTLTNDETYCSFLFSMINTDTESNEGANANSSYVKFEGSASGSTITANKYIGSLAKTLTFSAGAFAAKTYNNSSAVTVNIPTHTSHLTNDSGYLTQHLSLANYVTLNTAQTITGLKTFESNSNTTGVSIKLKNKGWAGNMSTAMDFYNGGSYTVPNARIETKMVGYGKAGGTLIFYTLTKHAETNPNPNGLTERLRIADDGSSTFAGYTYASRFIVEQTTSSALIIAANNNGRVSLQVDSSRGVYDHTKNAWLLGATTSGNTFLQVGNVGIGTSTPSEKLHVSGNVLATKFIKSGGTSAQFLKADGSVDSNTYATTSSLGNYLPLAGGTMNNGAIIKFNASGGLRQTTATTSNAATLILWYKGTDKDDNYSYAAQIGWHNTGNTDGAIYLVPNPQNSAPYSGSAGLYIGKTLFTWNNNVIIHAGNYTSYLPILNSASTHATKTSIIYAPTTVGTANLVLLSSGSGAPTWQNQSSIIAGRLNSTLIFSSNANSFNYVKFASINLTSRYSGAYSVLKLTRSFGTASNKGYSCDLYVHCYQQNSLGNSPAYTIQTNNDDSIFKIIGIINYSGTLSTLDLYVYGYGATYCGIVVTTISGNNIINIGSNLDTLPSGTVVTPSKVGHVKTANNGIFYIEGTGDTAGTWLGSYSEIEFYYTGLTIAYKIPIAGASTTTLNINNLGAKTCYINTSKLTTHYGVGSVAILVYDGTYFRAADYWDGNSYAYVRQYTTDSANAEYPLLFRYNTAAPTANGYVTEYTRYDSGITINPSTNTITTPGIVKTGNLVITLTTSGKHILFSRGSDTDYPYNYIAAPAGGFICILPDGAETSYNAGMQFSSDGLHPATNVAYSLGTSSLKWNAVYATNFHGALKGNADSASKLTTVSKTAWGLTYWTSGGVPTSISGDMTNVGNITIDTGNNDKFITFAYNNGTHLSWRIGYLGTGEGDTNYMVFLSNLGTAGGSYTNALRLGCTTLDAAFGGNVYPLVNNTKTLGTSSLKWKNVYATTFTGNLSGNATTANTLKSTTIVSAKALSLSSDTWTDTGYTFENLASGTYAIQITCGNLVASGIMSVYKNIDDTAGDEIPLHVYGTAGWRPYLRTYDNKLLISSNDASATSRTVTIKIALIL